MYSGNDCQTRSTQASPPSKPAAGRRILLCLLCYVSVASLLPFVADPERRNLSPEAAAGLLVWRANNCAACHSIYGLGGHMGPDLTNVIARRGRPYASHLLVHGKNKMPRYPLSETELAALLDYLESLNELGQYPLKSPDAKSFGNTYQATPQS